MEATEHGFDWFCMTAKRKFRDALRMHTCQVARSMKEDILDPMPGYIFSGAKKMQSLQD